MPNSTAATKPGPVDWALDHCKIGTWCIELENQQLTWSKQTYDIHEISPETQLSLQQAINFYLEEDRPFVREAVQHCIERGEEFNLQLRILTESGTIKWVRAMGRRVIEDDIPVRIEGVFQDIGNMVLLEREVETAQSTMEEYTDLLNRTNIIAKTDRCGIITFVNNKFCEISQYSRDELLGQDHRILSSGFHPKAFFSNLWATLASGHEWKGQIKNKAKDGSFYWVDTLIHPLKSKDGRITGYLSVRRDITREKEQQEVDIHTARLISIGETSTQIMHDVMNPLNIIQSCEYNLNQIKCDDATRAKLNNISEKITSSVRRIQSIFSDMRSMLVEDTKMEPMLICKLLDSCLEPMEQKIKNAGVKITRECNAAVIIGNWNLLSQVFTNLVQNALEAISELDDKWIKIEAINLGQHTFVRFIDSGRGIPQYVQQHMFDSFFTTKKDSGGSGIGLALCKRIIELHGASIQVNEHSPHTEIDVIFKSLSQSVSPTESTAH